MMEDPEDIFRRQLADNLKDLASFRMPFGKYGPGACPPKGMPLYDVPLDYLHWFLERGGGFPKGRLGELMEFVYHVKSAGAGEVFAPLREAAGGRKTTKRPRKREFKF